MTTDTSGRLPIHGYVEPDTHAAWHEAATIHRLSVSAILEALGPELTRILHNEPGLVTTAGQVDATRRGRGQKRARR